MYEKAQEKTNGKRRVKKNGRGEGSA